MTHLKYTKETSEVTRMDKAAGSVPRRQKKCLEFSSSSAFDLSLNNSRKAMSNISNSSNTNTDRTPRKKKEMHNVKKTPSKNTKKSPSCSTTPASKIPGNGGDRFIPSRLTTNFELGYYKQQCFDEEESKSECSSPSKKEIQHLIGEHLHGGDINNIRVLSYQNKVPSQIKTLSGYKSSSRHIPKTPDIVLDAPGFLDDYYLNLVDWQASNTLAVALGASVYLWNAETRTIKKLFELEGNDYVCSVSWVQEGPWLAVGTTLGNIELWSCVQMRRVRVMNGHSARVASLCWNSHILTSGCRAGRIIHHDVRQKDHFVSEINAHSEEVCGLKWSLDGRYLASGGNDNMLQVWPCMSGQTYSNSQPIYSFNQHKAAVKALAWCPWQNHILASGGGTDDKTIKFWNMNTGALSNSVDTESQVCSLLWSPTYKELVSGHGYAQNQLTIYKYPAMNKIAELTGHTRRVLHLAMSPDGTTVLSAGADETLRLWKCFLPDPRKEKEHAKVRPIASHLKQSIR